MIGRIVITSVPRGLDGGAGFQPVLRTHALRPSIAERLAMRAAYPHPFPFGDPRNPRVHFHRIELVGDRAIHVLGSVRDAGSSYTGRSNYLAELIAIDPAETPGLPGGPAYAARSFPWLGRWAGEPRETPLAAEPALPGRDPADPETTRGPAQCPAWQAATGDAGWAGELAKSFLDGKRALIWAGENIDVLELFVEALRLLPASARWQVTFNTCEIEPFPAHWRAVRPELGLVGNYEPSNELRLVLGKIKENSTRAPDHDLSRRARGETVVHQSQPTSPASGHGGELPSADDAALRARLREISEERRRRASLGRSARNGPSVQGTRSWNSVLLMLGVLLLGIIAIVPVVVISQRQDLQPLDDLRSDNPMQKQATASLNSQTQHGQPEADVGINLPDTPAPPTDQPNGKPKPMEAPVAESPPEDKTNNEQRRQAQNKAFENLVQGKATIPVRDEAFASNLDDSEKTKPVLVHESFDITNIFAPDLELASPYADKDRLRVREEAMGQDNQHVWRITGTFYDALHEKETQKEVGRLIARDKKLFLELDPQLGQKHPLFTRLENSVLLVSARSPEGHHDVRKKAIRLSEPIRPKTPYALDPLHDESEFSVRLEQEAATRMASIELRDKTDRGVKQPPKLFWEIELTHNALKTPMIITRNTAVHFEIPPSTADGLAIQYHIFKQPDEDETPEVKLQKRCAQLRCAMTVNFTIDPQGFPCFIVTRNFLAEPQDGIADDAVPDHVELKKLSETFEPWRLRPARDEKEPKKAIAAVTDAFLTRLNTQHDPELLLRQQTLKERLIQRDTIPKPGDARVRPNNDENRKAYAEEWQNADEKLSAAKTALETWIKKRNRAFDDDSNKLKDQLSGKNFKAVFGVVHAQIKRVWAIAHDEKHSRDEIIPIVESAP